jgi:hypothetical protein
MVDLGQIAKNLGGLKNTYTTNINPEFFGIFSQILSFL